MKGTPDQSAKWSLRLTYVSNDGHGESSCEIVVNDSWSGGTSGMSCEESIAWDFGKILAMLRASGGLFSWCTPNERDACFVEAQDVN